MKLDEWLQSEVQLEDMETQSPMMSIFTAELGAYSFDIHLAADGTDYARFVGCPQEEWLKTKLHHFMFCGQHNKLIFHPLLVVKDMFLVHQRYRKTW
jgi:hypothetical protein